MLLVLLVRQPGLAPFTLAPISLMMLDTYCLAQERRIRTTHERFLRKLHEGELTVTDLFESRTRPAKACCGLSWAS